MKTIADIKAIRDKMQSQILLRQNPTDSLTLVVVGMATSGISAGAQEVFNVLVDEVADRRLANIKVMRTGDLGTVEKEPVVEVFVPHKEKVTYVSVTPDKAKEIVEKHLIGGEVCTEYTA